MNDLTSVVGTELTLETEVKSYQTAKAMRSGGVDVLATPYMIAFMEHTSAECVRSFLDPGYVTVGTLVNVKHLASTPVGMEVSCTAKLVECDGRRLVFEVEARDDVETIGTGIHERFIVNAERFVEKANAKGAIK